LVAERSTFWCIAIFHRDEELNSQKTVEEEDPKSKSSLEIRKICVCLLRTGCQIVVLLCFGIVVFVNRHNLIMDWLCLSFRLRFCCTCG